MELSGSATSSLPEGESTSDIVSRFSSAAKLAERIPVLANAPQAGSSTVADLRSVRPSSSAYHVEPQLIRPTVPSRSDGRSDRFVVLESWEGLIEEIFDTYFTARVKSRGKPEEFAEILTDQISKYDLDLFEEGAVFYWSVGYHESAGGQRRKESVIRIRRLPRLTKSDIAQSEKWVARIAETWLRQR